MKCIFCDSKNVQTVGAHEFFCRDCKAQFDPEDDGDYSDRNPSARLERDERRGQKQSRRPRR